MHMQTRNLHIVAKSRKTIKTKKKQVSIHSFEKLYTKHKESQQYCIMAQMFSSYQLYNTGKYSEREI